MLTKYIQAAMHHAEYEIIEDDHSFYGNIPELEGLWANAVTLEACRDELRSTLEDWLLLGLAWLRQRPLFTWKCGILRDHRAAISPRGLRIAS